MKEKTNKNNKVSLSQVAKAAGVSKMTASRVLRGEGGYSDNTRDLVLQKVDELGYLPNRLATPFKLGPRRAFPEWQAAQARLV